MNNALRHGESARIEIELMERQQCLELRVEDRGIGFEWRPAEFNGFGLEAMRQRARLVGGEIVIETAPGHGTRVRAWLPRVVQNASATDPHVERVAV